MPDAPRHVLLITRPRPAAERLAAEVAARFPGRFAPVVAPLMAIRARPAPPPPKATTALIFTSENAVELFAAAHPGRNLAAFCVGERTAQAARAAGFSAHAARGTGADLARVLAAALPTGARLYHPRGAHKAGDLAAALADTGIAIVEAVIYDQAAVPLTGDACAALMGRTPVIAPLFSPRTARLFADALPGDATARLTAVCLSPAVAAALPAGMARIVAADPSQAALLDALEALT
jgi:uroporphyrinogen-III synthase